MQRFRRTFDESLFYYQIGDSKTFNKFEAIKWANGDVSKIHFHFLDDIWDSMDVTVEPTETWSELMRERCLQFVIAIKLFLFPIAVVMTAKQF
jgi:hypothetical protein